MLLQLAGFATLMLPILSFAILERVGGAKHLQKVSGVHPITFWFSTWLYDSLYLILIFTLVLPFFTLFEGTFDEVDI